MWLGGRRENAFANCFTKTYFCYSICAYIAYILLSLNYLHHIIIPYVILPQLRLTLPHRIIINIILSHIIVHYHTSLHLFILISYHYSTLLLNFYSTGYRQIVTSLSFVCSFFVSFVCLHLCFVRITYPSFKKFIKFQIALLMF